MKQSKYGETLQVLDKGYVRLVDVMGSDLSAANAARASFAKESDELTKSDAKLIAFLVKHHHTSPFRHAFATFEVSAPLLVARQWWKYVVGSDHIMDGWNEASRRYVTLEPQFHIPQTWRAMPDNRKQGSGGAVEDEKSRKMSDLLEKHAQNGLDLYNEAMNQGIAPEQARLFLPAYAMFTTWRWSVSLQGIGHFLAQRLDHEAQWEIQQYAKAVKQLVSPYFPVSVAAFSEAS